MEIKDKNIMQLWKKVVNKILEEGEEYIDNNNRICKELLNGIIILENPSSSEVQRPINHLKNFDEWIYPSKEELSGVMFKDTRVPIYEYTYGGRIFNFNEVKDQIREFIIPLLKRDPESRRGVINIYDPIADSDLTHKNTPSMMYINVRIKNNKLLLTAHIRSNDILFGWPANIYQIFSIQEYIAKKLDLELGDLSLINNSLHLFLDPYNPLLDSLKS